MKMRTNKILFILFLFTFSLACSDDDNVKVETGPIPLSEWEGSWNDPSHPEFKPDGYNPIQGRWKVYMKNGLPVGTTIKIEYEFTSDFIFKVYNNGSYQSDKKYQINDQHYLVEKEGNNTDFLYQYRLKMENGTNNLVVFDGEKTYQFYPVIE